MTSKIPQLLHFLAAARESRNDGLSRAAQIISNKGQRAIALLKSRNSPFGNHQLEDLLVRSSEAIRAYAVQKRITDWPFENFWDNPYEPRHSKLLRFFIDPSESHNCGSVMLRQLVDVLIPGNSLSTENCVISGRDYIDILIERKGDYAIILENKINGAQDQFQQLAGYVDKLLREKFAPENIYVFYLPLAAGKIPNRADVEAVKNKGVRVCKIVTFANEIVKWLNLVLEENILSQMPPLVRDGMKENLSHYRNLVTFLVNKQKANRMDAQILKQLQIAAERNVQPSWNDAKDLVESANELLRCMRMMLSGRFLLRLKDLLKKADVEAYLAVDGVWDEPLSVTEYDTVFKEAVTVSVQINEAIMLCFGCSPGEKNDSYSTAFWTGCLDRNGAGKYKAIIEKELARFFRELHTNAPWYGWDWNPEITFENCECEFIAEQTATKLLEMLKALRSKIQT
jgi:PD-(D/E)XK nuclease superfamily